MTKGAEISKDGLYRYSLTRTWQRAKDKVMFIMLNPSTADDKQDDNTIRRCMGYARDWGFGGLVVTNLFAYRTKSPEILRQVGSHKGKEYIVGPDNDSHILETYMDLNVKKVVLAWGAHGGLYERDKEVTQLWKDTTDLYCLDYTAVYEMPKHPLYLPKDIKLKPWPKK